MDSRRHVRDQRQAANAMCGKQALILHPQVTTYRPLRKNCTINGSSSKFRISTRMRHSFQRQSEIICWKRKGGRKGEAAAAQAAPHPSKFCLLGQRAAPPLLRSGSALRLDLDYNLPPPLVPSRPNCKEGGGEMSRLLGKGRGSNLTE